MGFVDVFFEAFKKAHNEQFEGVDLRLGEAANYNPTGLGLIFKKTDCKWLNSMRLLADAYDLTVIRRKRQSSEYLQDKDVIPGDEDDFSVILRVLWAGKELCL